MCDASAKPLIVTGPRRSGTHLVYRLLDGHPDLFNSLYEVHYFEYLSSLDAEKIHHVRNIFNRLDLDELIDQVAERDLFPCYLKENIEKYRDDLVGVARSDVLTIGFNDLRESLEENRYRFENLRQIFDWWYKSIFNAIGIELKQIRYIVVPSPDYGLSAESASQYFDEFKVLLVLRRPEAIVNSLRKLRSKQPYRRDFSLFRVLPELKRYQEYCERLEILLKRDDCKLVIYEDLVSRHDEVMKEIAEFLGIEFEEILLRPSFLGKNWKGDSSFGELEGVSEEPLQRGVFLLSDFEKELIGEYLKACSHYYS
jgi:hypothetical protein